MKKRGVGRPKKESGEVLVDLPIKVDPKALEDMESIADQLDRPRGWVARKLLMRGMEVYFRDLKTTGPEIAIQTEQEQALRTVRLASPEDVEELIGELNGGKLLVNEVSVDRSSKPKKTKKRA